MVDDKGPILSTLMCSSIHFPSCVFCHCWLRTSTDVFWGPTAGGGGNVSRRVPRHLQDTNPQPRDHARRQGQASKGAGRFHRHRGEHPGKPGELFVPVLANRRVLPSSVGMGRYFHVSCTNERECVQNVRWLARFSSTSMLDRVKGKH